MYVYIKNDVLVHKASGFNVHPYNHVLPVELSLKNISGPIVLYALKKRKNAPSGYSHFQFHTLFTFSAFIYCLIG